MTFRDIQPFDFDSIQYEKEVATLAFYVKATRIIHAFRGMASLWWPDQGIYAVAVRRDPDITNRYNLLGIGSMLGEETLSGFGKTVPRKFGYLEFNPKQGVPADFRTVFRRDKGASKWVEAWPIDVKLVNVLPLSGNDFWEALAYILKSMFASDLYKPRKVRSKGKEKLERVQRAVNVTEQEKVQNKIYLPKRSAEFRKWKAVYKKIRGNQNTYNEISRQLREEQKQHLFNKNYPTSPDTIAAILKAGEAGLLD